MTSERSGRVSEATGVATFAGLLAVDRATQLDAIEALDLDARGAEHALRGVLLEDDDADVRAAAAARLGDAKRPSVAPALEDALFDTHPSVRLAACRALARTGAAAPETLRRLALEEPIWWVRRGAALALARLDKQRAIPTLLAVLDDPFWRVRHAAVRALLVLGAKDAHVEEAIASATPESDRARGAHAYLARKLGIANERPAGDDARRPPEGRLADPDPAVIAARLEHGLAATHAELALYLGDSHEALRRAASERLVSNGDLRALLAATLWLEEPRIPYVAETVVGMLDRLAPKTLGEMLDAALAEPDARPGACVWAISLVGAGGRFARFADVLRALGARHAGVRRAATAALGALFARDDDDARADATLARLAALQDDADADVRRIALHGLATANVPPAWEAAIARPLGTRGPLETRLVVLAAARVLAREDLDADETSETDRATRARCVALLREAARVTDARTRASALAALDAAGLLDDEARAAARASDDPWLRRAVLDGSGAVDALANDPDPSLRRVAFVAASHAGLAAAAARVAARDADPWLRAHAAERLARSPEDADLALVVELARDPEPAVRAAAADATVAHPALAPALERLRAAASEPARATIDTWLGVRAADEIARAEAAPATAAPRTDANEPRSTPSTPFIASPRALGKTGITVSPLAISGAHEPSISALFRAMHAGCNLFFWEPRHRNLSTFLRAVGARGTAPRVIAGTYHATARAIRADIERALRRLRRERLDVFLVYWVRSAARFSDEVAGALEQAKRDGLVAATGFSTHDRALAATVLGASPWDVMMIRHSAAHPGAEDGLFACAQKAGTGVLSFSATSYSRLLDGAGALTAPECYRYSLSQPGVSACLSAPRGVRQIVENLEVLETPTLPDARLAEARAHGRLVREESLDFGRHIRRFPTLPDGDALDALLDAELTVATSATFL